MRLASFALVLALLWVPLWASPARAQSTIYLVRHAEKLDESRDPPLTKAGRAAAERLAAIVRELKPAALYASDLRRTVETAQPSATALGLPIVRVDGFDVPALVARLRREHPKQAVLVVGHSNTIPDLVRAYGGPKIEIGPREYDVLYVLTPLLGGASLTQRKY